MVVGVTNKILLNELKSLYPAIETEEGHYLVRVKTKNDAPLKHHMETFSKIFEEDEVYMVISRKIFLGRDKLTGFSADYIIKSKAAEKAVYNNHYSKFATNSKYSHNYWGNGVQSFDNNFILVDEAISNNKNKLNLE